MRRPPPPALRRARGGGGPRIGTPPPGVGVGVGVGVAARSRLFLVGALVLVIYGLVAALLLTTYRGMATSAAAAGGGGGGGAGGGGGGGGVVPLEAGVNSVVRGGGRASSAAAGPAAANADFIRERMAEAYRKGKARVDKLGVAGAGAGAAAAGGGGGGKKLLGGRLMRRQYEGAKPPSAGGREEAPRDEGDDAEDRDSPEDIGLDAGEEVRDDDEDEEEDDDDEDDEEAGDDERDAEDDAAGIDNEGDQKHFGRENDGGGGDDGAGEAKQALRAARRAGGRRRPVLAAYVEPIYQSDWSVRPLPARNATASVLAKSEFPGLNSCLNLPGQFPVDEPCPSDDDPFLPWIHDVFPTADGRFVQFVAQNKRRCQSGKLMGEIKRKMQPQAALFQHVPVKRIEGSGDETRYRLSSHEEADPDGVETRFLCKFHSSESADAYETLSVFNFDYDYHTYRKGYKSTFTEEGFDNHMIWSSQLLFRCPVPPPLVAQIKSGETVKDDYATWFVDVAPIRTPPRYGHPTEFFPPRYRAEAETARARGGKDLTPALDADEMWGTDHVLPRIEDSGRWENVPVCKPSLMTYADSFVDADGGGGGGDGPPIRKVEVVADPDGTEREVDKRFDLVACVWTSASFHTRGERRHITDNVDRLREWLEFNLLTGFDHVFVYDNTAAQSESQGESLQPVVDLFPGRATRIDWPCRVCNNRPGTGDNKGERSSQYAAESSCRLRFGTHAEWMGSFDIDEYMTPVGRWTGMKELLSHLDREEGVKVLSFKSKRAWPRLDFLEDPAKTHFKDDNCPRGCFHPKVRDDVTFMQAHNCNKEKPPRKDLMPAEKQIYKADHVLLHFVHYSTVTRLSVLNKEQTQEAGYQWLGMYKDRHTRVADEVEWATMLHGKSIVYDQTEDHENGCKMVNHICKLGFPFPEGKDRSDGAVKVGGGYLANCFVDEKIERYWVPRLEEALRSRGKPALA